MDEIKDTVQHIAIVDQSDIQPLVKEIERVNHMSPVAKMILIGLRLTMFGFKM